MRDFRYTMNNQFARKVIVGDIQKEKKMKRQMVLALCLCLTLAGSPVSAAASDSLLSVTEEAQIRPIGAGSGRYLMKSDGSKDVEASVHYFDKMEIDGTVLDGFYYHDADGCYLAASPHMVKISDLTCMRTDENGESEEYTFDGYYMVNNLGKLTAAPQVRYIDNLTMDGVTFDGYYYFDETGRMVTEPGIHELEMTSNGQMFSGTYYFGGENGVLEQKSGITPDGFPVDETGKVQGIDELGIENLKPQLESVVSGYDGDWSVYVKDLGTEEELVINDEPMYSASLIKAFVMAKTFEDMDLVLENEAEQMKTDITNAAVQKKIDDLLINMITVSDNESCNELGRLQSEKHDFLNGAEKVNEYLEKEGYSETSYQSTLHPSESPKLSLGGRNMTSVKDCGLLLERIYRGECVSEEASQQMLDLLKRQENTTKIPAGIQAEVVTANKTGETDEDQHDIAIVYGTKTTYILCVMSDGWKEEADAVQNIRNISSMVYNYLNL